MLGWVQRVLPQPPGAPQKTKREEEEDQAEPEPEPKAEAEPEPEPETEEPATLPPEEPFQGDEVDTGYTSPQEMQEVARTLVTSRQAQVAVGPEVNSSRGWVLTWLRTGMEKVAPQPSHGSRPAQSTAGLGNPAQAGAQVLGRCGTGGPDGAREALRAPDTGPRPWLLRWVEQSLEKVLPQPPKTSVGCRDEPADAAWGADSPEPRLETESTLQVTESPILPTLGPLEPEEEPTPDPQTAIQASSLPLPGDTARLVAWLWHSLEKVLPQPVLQKRAGEQEPDAPVTCDMQTRLAAPGGL